MLNVDGFFLNVNKSDSNVTIPLSDASVAIIEIHPDKTCRLCLKIYEPDNLIGFFSSDIESQNSSMASILSTCFKIEFHQGKDLPNFLCASCASIIMIVQAFRECIETSESILKNRENPIEGNPQKVTSSQDVLQNGAEENNPPEEVKPSESDNSSKVLHNHLLDHDYAKEPKHQMNKKQTKVAKRIPKKKTITPWWSRTKEPPYICKICGLNYGVCYKKFYKHVRTHLMAKLACEYCGKRFSRQRLQVHLRSHTQEKPYLCTECPARFNVSANLTRHKRCHTGEKLYVCKICSKVYTQSINLKQHQLTHSGSSEFPKIKNLVEEKSYFCEYCKRGFKSEVELGLHLKLQNKTSCKICCQNLSNAFNLRVHMLWHELQERESFMNDLQKWICDLCNMECNSFKSLNLHILTHLDNRKTYTCTICDKVFATKRTHDAHLLAHKGTLPYLCDVCSKTFISPSILKRHYRIHTGERPYKCEICSKCFTQRQHLGIHMVTHTGEKRYLCQYCGKRFSANSSLVVHKRRHTGETPYVCEWCKKGFHEIKTFKRHIKVNHQKD